jgi:hypothetical protein
MDSNKHVHHTSHDLELEPPKARISGLWLLGVLAGVVVVGGVLVMGYNLVREQLNLTDFQAFVSVVLGGIGTIVGGIYAKISLDRKADQEFKKWQIQKTMEHEEIMEKTRMQTNGRLHKRDELIYYQMQLDEAKDGKIAILELGEDLSPLQEKTLVKIEGDITYLKGRIRELSQELVSLKPLYPKEAE